MQLLIQAFIGFVLLALPVLSATLSITVPPETEKSRRLVLHFEDLKLPPNSGGLVRVFADLPSANAHTDVDDEHFLGYFTVIPKTSGEAAAGVSRRHVTLDVTQKKQFLSGKKDVTLTLVPAVTVGRAYLAAD